MKTKNIFKKVLLTICIVVPFVISCSSSDEGGSGGSGGVDPVTEITLSADDTTVIEGQSVTFSVVDNLNNNVTSEATFSINGSTITNPYTFNTGGTHNVVASYDSLTSNTVSITVESETSIQLSFSSNPATNDEMVTFTVVNNLGTDVTASSTFSIGGTTITNPYQFPSIGEFTVEVSYSTFSTSSMINIVRNYTKKALLEDFTGTWCPNCPPAAASVANAIASNSNIFGVGYHAGGGDPMEIPETGYWSNYYNVTGFPTVYVNGADTRWNFPNMTQVNNELAEDATLGLGVDSQLNGNTIDINVKVGFSEIPTENLKLMVYLVEDNVTTSTAQAGSSQGASYVHRDVLREVYTNQLGDAFPFGSISLTSDYEVSMTGLALPSNISNTNNLKVIVFVRNTYVKTFTDYFGTVHTNSPHYDIYNVQEVHVGSSQDFD